MTWKIGQSNPDDPENVAHLSPTVPLGVSIWAGDTHAGLAMAVGTLTPDTSRAIQATNTGGRLAFQVPRQFTSDWGLRLQVQCEGYVPLDTRINCKDKPDHSWDFDLAPAHVDPDSIPVGQLLAVRGAIWTARYPCSQGPRPGSSDNINALDELECFPVDEQVAMMTAYRAEGYRHFPLGPFALEATNPSGYHGLYGLAPGLRNDPQWYLDLLQRTYDNGLIPAYFYTPDNWTIDQLRAYEPFFTDPRFQKLLRIVVPYGWEPNSGDKYGIQNAQYCERFRYVAGVLPNAYKFLHLCTDDDAPVGSDDDQMGKDKAWQNLAAAGLWGWLDQVQGYLDSGPNVTPEFLANLQQRVQDITGRFRSGSWGRRTDGGEILYVGGEYAAYRNMNGDGPPTYANPWPESAAQQVGDAFMQFGARGYFDGGTVDVPEVE